MVEWLKVILVAAAVMVGLWVLSPVDLLPEFLPVIGPLDDVVVVALALRYAARRVPRQVLAGGLAGRAAAAGALDRQPCQASGRAGGATG